jgi:hypothetical protein
MQREMERMEQLNEGHMEQIDALRRKKRALEKENEELKVTSPSECSIGSALLDHSSMSTTRQSEALILK